MGVYKALLPPRARTGRPKVDDRKSINGILYMLVTGCRWMDMLIGTAYTRLVRRDLALERDESLEMDT